MVNRYWLTYTEAAPPPRQQALPDRTRHFPKMSANNPLSGRKRLDSWKEIAAFFGRDERTVNRWEKDLALPVHRLPGTKGRVYAFTDELTAWLKAGALNPVTMMPPRSEAPAEIELQAGRRLTVVTGGPPEPGAISTSRHWQTTAVVAALTFALGFLVSPCFTAALPPTPLLCSLSSMECPMAAATT